jgi:N-acyl amino acid synthase of PEP-CTERM/exosortase system
MGDGSKMSSEKFSLTKSFQEYFTVEFAQTAEQKSKVYGVRYRVYCDEFGYESVDRFPNQEESDEFDDFSLHCLIMHTNSGLPAGCVRLVPVYDDNGVAHDLPLEQHCRDSLDQEYIDSLNLDRHTVCEISRLAVDRLFRRRTGEELTRFGKLEGLDCSKLEQRTFSLIAVAAFLAATAMTDINGKTNVFAMMEPFLPRLMHRSGIDFQKSGFDTDYRGIRAPYFIQTQSALVNMHPDLKALYAWIYKQIKENK